MNRHSFYSLTFILALLVPVSTAWAQDGFPRLKAVPWNGHKAAISLTFDDSNPVYLDEVIPELNQRQLHATFFLIANKTSRKDEWRQAIKAGHEIGSETLDDLHANVLSSRDENAQVVGAQNVLQKEFGVSIDSFAYPYGEVSPGLKNWVEKTSFIGRGQLSGWISPKDTSLDWFNLPAKISLSDDSLQTHKGWINKAVRQGTWLIWDIPGMEDSTSDTKYLSLKIFEQTLDYLSSKDIWIGTFLEVGSYLRAWQSFEVATILETDTEADYHWTIPNNCPINVRFKVYFPGRNQSVQVWQNGGQILPDAQGNYTILFNPGQLSLRRSGL